MTTIQERIERCRKWVKTLSEEAKQPSEDKMTHEYTVNELTCLIDSDLLLI